MDKAFEWLAKPEVWGIVLGVGLPLALTPVLIWWARRSRSWASLNSVNFFLFDQDKRFVHIIGAHTYMPDDAPTVDVYHHRLLDRTTGKIYQGGLRHGGGIDLDSNFIKETTAILQAAVHQALNFSMEKNFSFHSGSEDTGNIPHCTERDWFESDTTKAEPPPHFGVIFRQYDGDREKFRMEVYAGRQLLVTHVLPGSISAFKALYDAEKQQLLFVYAHGTFYRIGICVLDMRTGAIMLKRLVKPDIKAG